MGSPWIDDYKTPVRFLYCGWFLPVDDMCHHQEINLTISTEVKLLPWNDTFKVCLLKGWEPPNHCEVPEGQWLNKTIPTSPGGELEKCVIYSNYSLGNHTQDCDNWQYDDQGYTTIVTEVSTCILSKYFNVDVKIKRNAIIVNVIHFISEDLSIWMPIIKVINST